MKHKYGLYSITFSVIGTLILTGCNSNDAKNLTQDTRKLAQTTGTALGNATLAGKVNTVLSLRKGVDMSGLHIEATDGIVTLGGHVRNRAERKRILQTVDGIRGVDKIIADDLRVSADSAK